MGELIHETAGREERRLLLLLMVLLLVLLLLEAASRNWNASKTIVETIALRRKVVAGLQQAFVPNAVRRLLFLVWKWEICCVGEFSIENAAIRVLMKLFRCIHIVVRRTDAIAVVVVAHVTRTLELVQIHQLSHQADVFVI